MSDQTDVKSIPSSIEHAGNPGAVSRSAADIDQEILADVAKPESDPVAPGGEDRLADDNQPPKTKGFESAKDEWWYIANMGLRVLKGLFFHRRKITKEKYDETASLWAEYLTKKFPEGVDDSELIMAVMATGAMFVGSDELPGVDDEKGGVRVYLKRIFLALLGR